MLYNQIFRQPWVIPLAIFFVALTARVMALDEFITVDEPVWLERVQGFSLGLLFSDHQCPPEVPYGLRQPTQGWGCTLQVFYPGVTVMWGGTLGLLAHYGLVGADSGLSLREYLQNLGTNPVDPNLLIPVRLPLVLLSASFVSVFYLLLRKLATFEVAIIAALLLALDPFHVALSRILHTDATTTTFVALSLLTAIGFWLQNKSWRWLWASAVCGGLALLTKPIGWFVVPAVGMVGFIGWLKQGRYSGQSAGVEFLQILKTGLIWGIIAIIVFVVLFPALWVIPRQVLQIMIEDNTGVASVGHINGHYFLGQITRNPGPLFYPVAWGLRTSPLVLISVVLFVFASAKLLTQSALRVSLKQLLNTPPVYGMSLLFVVTFLIFVTLPSKKMDRYFLPVYPFMAILAAAGSLWLVRSVKRSYRRWGWVGVIAVVTLVQGWLVWQTHPYHFTYYNPIFGGTPGAARVMTLFGWGEGLNEAADYLNQQPNASTSNTVTPLPNTFAPFFVGNIFQTNDVSQILQADYVIYYQSQIQRNLQRLDVWNYLHRHKNPVHRVTLQGVDYVLVYASPLDHSVDPLENSLPDMYTLGYNLDLSGQLTIVWQNLGFEKPVWAGLLPVDGEQILWTPCRLAAEFVNETNIPGAILESQCNLAATQAAPGLYDLRLGYGTAEKITEVDFPAGRLAIQINADGSFSPANPKMAIEQVAQAALAETAIPLDEQIGSSVRLVGYRFSPADVGSGQPINLSLYWQALQNLDLTQFANVFELSFELADESFTTDAQSLGSQPLTGTADNTYIKQGAVAPIQYRLSLPPQITPGAYRLNVDVIDTTSAQIVKRVSLPIKIKGSTE